jgi:hypothetical protein
MTNRNGKGRMNQIQLALTLDEVNVVLDALGRRPFARVHHLIAKIHQQAGSQINEAATSAAVLTTDQS